MAIHFHALLLWVRVEDAGQGNRGLYPSKAVRHRERGFNGYSLSYGGTGADPLCYDNAETHPCVMWTRPGELAEGVTPGVGSAGQGTRGPRVTLQTPPGVTG